MTAAPAPQSAPRERPILFSAPMVQAILTGRKTVTRRLVKADGIAEAVSGHFYPSIGQAQFRRADGRDSMPLACPYGRPGDRLWVRETWAPVACPQHDEGQPPGTACRCREALYRATDRETVFPHGGGWRPSIHMPRRASRLTLEVTDVRVERLQDISEEDARAEGIPDEPQYRPLGTPQQWFASLWDSINGERASWASNPFVWAISFRRLP